jgi:SRSO17 transposase
MVYFVRMTETQLERCRKRLEGFLVDLLAPVGRSERRHWGSVYVRGLLLDGERKSVEPMAGRLPDGNEQAMQQFVGQSPWDWKPIWERLAQRMVRELEPDAIWVIDDTGFPKQGAHSVGVARQYSGTLGKTANCQVAVSMHEVCTEGAAVLNWRLYLPESWTEDAQRRAEAGIPEDVKFKKKWELALEMIDQVRQWDLADRIVVADAGYGDVTAFREALESRNLRYAVGVQSSTGVWTEVPRPLKLGPKETGRPPSALHYGKQRPVSVREAAQQAQGWKKIRWREGSKGWLQSRFWAGRVRPSHGFHEGREAGKEVWLLVEWPDKAEAPTKYFLCDLPANYSLRRLVQIAKARWKIEQDYQQLKEELGLDHYEGRSWIGWHHHVTLVMLAHSFLTLETLRNKKNFWLDPAEDAS